MNHLAIMREPWLSMVENGTKTIESRISQKKIAPWQKVRINDWIYFRLSGNSLVSTKAKVIRVEYYLGSIIFKKLYEYHTEIGINQLYIDTKLKCK